MRSAFTAEHDLTWKLLIDELDPTARVIEPQAPPNSRPLLCVEGEFIEKAACNFTHSRGDALPQAASSRNPGLAGKPFSASSLSVIVHPRVPHIPTTHMNVRFFYVDDGEGYWHFGGGMDLTPHFLFRDDVTDWHTHAMHACDSTTQYVQFKKQCDQYFYLPHREEARGVGGLFFDDLNEPNFSQCLVLAKSICERFRIGYSMIFNRRKTTQWSEDDEAWMLHRRSRYAEFNLIYDRGTKYGLQSGRRVDSVLASMPPRASWTHPREPETQAQNELVSCLQNPREWV